MMAFYDVAYLLLCKELLWLHYLSLIQVKGGFYTYLRTVAHPWRESISSAHPQREQALKMQDGIRRITQKRPHNIWLYLQITECSKQTSGDKGRLLTARRYKKEEGGTANNMGFISDICNENVLEIESGFIYYFIYMRVLMACLVSVGVRRGCPICWNGL